MYSRAKRKKTQHIRTVSEIWCKFKTFDLHWPGLENALDSILYRPNLVQVSNALSLDDTVRFHELNNILYHFSRGKKRDIYIHYFLLLISRNAKLYKSNFVLKHLFRLCVNPKYEILLDLVLETCPFAVTLGSNLIVESRLGLNIFRKMVNAHQGISYVRSSLNILPFDSSEGIELILRFGRKLFNIGQKPDFLPLYLHLIFCHDKYNCYKCRQVRKKVIFDSHIVTLWLQHFRDKNEMKISHLFRFVSESLNQNTENTRNAFTVLTLILQYFAGSIPIKDVDFACKILDAIKYKLKQFLEIYSYYSPKIDYLILHNHCEIFTPSMLQVNLMKTEQVSFKFSAKESFSLLTKFVQKKQFELFNFVFDRLNYDYYYDTLDKFNSLNYQVNEEIKEHLWNRMPEIYSVIC